MAEYNRWMNARLYEAAAKLPEGRIHEDQGAFFGSLFSTLNHIAVADLIWLHRFAQLPELSQISAMMEALPRPTTLREPVATTLSELIELRTKTDSIICRLATEATDDLFAETLRYRNTAGQSQAKRFGLVVQHFFNHQAHHRGQATTLLFQAGVDIGVTDLIVLIPSEA